MVNLFGDKRKFAIQAKLEYLTESGTPVGRICIWVGGDQIGDFEGSYEVLGYCMAGFDNFVRNMGTSVDPLIDGKSKEDIISFLQKAVCGELRDFSEGDKTFEDRFVDFVLCPELGEAFENEFVVVLTENPFSRIIWVDLNSDTSKEFLVPQSDIREATKMFSKWLNEVQLHTE